MFFDNLSDIPKLAEKCGCSIFVMPDDLEIDIKNAQIIEREKTVISMDQIKDVIAHIGSKQTTAKYIIFKQADRLGNDAANAFLKSLEEPKENYHFILQTSRLSEILPTILSRSEIFILREQDPLNKGIDADENIKNLAKRLIVAKDVDYLDIMNEITKKKDDTREYALKVLETAIDMSYKSYFKTNNQVFVKKLPKFLAAYENIAANGHIKLHLVADML